MINTVLVLAQHSGPVSLVATLIAMDILVMIAIIVLTLILRNYLVDNKWKYVPLVIMMICLGLGITILSPPFRRARRGWREQHNKRSVDAIFAVFIIEFVIVLSVLLVLFITSSVMLTTCAALLPLFGMDRGACGAW